VNGAHSLVVSGPVAVCGKPPPSWVPGNQDDTPDGEPRVSFRADGTILDELLQVTRTLGLPTTGATDRIYVTGELADPDLLCSAQYWVDRYANGALFRHGHHKLRAATISATRIAPTQSSADDPHIIDHTPTNQPAPARVALPPGPPRSNTALATLAELFVLVCPCVGLGCCPFLTVCGIAYTVFDRTHFCCAGYRPRRRRCDTVDAEF